jgi:hypothetical protein
MTLFNLFRRKPEPITVPPGEIHVTRNWNDDPERDTTVLTIGGQVESAALEAIRLILKGKAHVRRYGREKGLRVKRQEGIL